LHFNFFKCCFSFAFISVFLIENLFPTREFSSQDLIQISDISFLYYSFSSLYFASNNLLFLFWFYYYMYLLSEMLDMSIRLKPIVRKNNTSFNFILCKLWKQNLSLFYHFTMFFVKLQFMST
jgi:hypothetical protein